MPNQHDCLPYLEFNFFSDCERAELPPDKLDYGKIAEDANALFHPFTALLTIPGFGS